MHRRGSRTNGGRVLAVLRPQISFTSQITNESKAKYRFIAQPGVPICPCSAGGGGGGIPGVPICPAKAGTISIRVRNVAASVDFILLISVS